MRIVPSDDREDQVGTVFIHQGTEVHKLWQNFKNMDFYGEYAFSPLASSRNSEEWESMNISHEDYTLNNDLFMNYN